MEKITKYFKYSYENDTTIEYVTTGLYSMLNCSYTSEDPDYGTDTIHYTSVPVKSIEQMAYEMLGEVKDFLDWRDGMIDASRSDVQNDYDQYSDSTLIAIEDALTDISKDYSPVVLSRDGNEMRFVNVCEFADLVMDSIINHEKVYYDVATGDINDLSLQDVANGKGEVMWCGVKWIPLDMFDGTSFDWFVLIGHWGGGFAEAMYFNSNEREYFKDELIKKMKYEFDVSTAEKIAIEIIKQKEEK